MTNKAIFLNRDNTLISCREYVTDPEQVKLLEWVAPALIELKKMGYKLVVVSNQSAVAKGVITEDVLKKINQRLKDVLARSGAFLDAIYCCPYHQDGTIEKYQKESELTKPAPGMLLLGAEEMDIDLSASWMIGNHECDIQAGKEAGCRTILLDNNEHKVNLNEIEPKPDYLAVNMREAVNIIKKEIRKPAVVTNIEEATETQTSDDPVSQEQIDKPMPQEQIEEAEKTTVQEQAEPEEVPAEKPKKSPSPKQLTIKKTEPDNSEPEMELDSIGDIEAEILVGEPKKDTNELLERILDHLNRNSREELFEEFSIMRFLAGIVQVAVLLCLLLAIWFMMNPAKSTTAVFVPLGFGLILQVMSLTFYNMRK